MPTSFGQPENGRKTANCFKPAEPRKEKKRRDRTYTRKKKDKLQAQERESEGKGVAGKY